MKTDCGWFSLIRKRRHKSFQWRNQSLRGCFLLTEMIDEMRWSVRHGEPTFSLWPFERGLILSWGIEVRQRSGQTPSTIGRNIVIVNVFIVCGSRRGRQSQKQTIQWEARVGEIAKDLQKKKVQHSILNCLWDVTLIGLVPNS